MWQLWFIQGPSLFSLKSVAQLPRPAKGWERIANLQSWLFSEDARFGDEREMENHQTCCQQLYDWLFDHCCTLAVGRSVGPSSCSRSNVALLPTALRRCRTDFPRQMCEKEQSNRDQLWPWILWMVCWKEHQMVMSVQIWGLHCFCSKLADG